MPSALDRQEYRLVPWDQVKRHPKNRRVGDVDAIVESIRLNGWIGAGYLQRSTGFLIVGNHRYDAGCEVRSLVERATAGEDIDRADEWARWPERFGDLDGFPVIDIDVDDETAERYLIADNAVADRASWRIEDLAADLDAIMERQGSLFGTGYTTVEFEALMVTVKYHQQGRPSLAEMQGKYGDPDEAALWPLVHVKIPPAWFDRYAVLMAGFGDDPESDRFVMLIEAAERGVVAHG